MASRQPPTEQLLDAWRRAESAINDVRPGSTDYARAVQEANARREAYQHRIDDLEDERRSLTGHGAPPTLAAVIQLERPLPEGDPSHHS